MTELLVLRSGSTLSVAERDAFDEAGHRKPAIVLETRGVVNLTFALFARRSGVLRLFPAPHSLVAYVAQIRAALGASES